MVSRFITAARLGVLLSEQSDPASEGAAAIVARLGPDADLRLGTQPAEATARTMQLKYGLARERGADVLGLDRLVGILTAMGNDAISACVAEGSGEFAVVVLDEETSRVVASLHVITGAEG